LIQKEGSTGGCEIELHINPIKKSNTSILLAKIRGNNIQTNEFSSERYFGFLTISKHASFGAIPKDNTVIL
jgi:hypothetical protein